MQFFISVLTLAALAAAAPMAEPVAQVNEIAERAPAFKAGFCGIHGKLSYAYGGLSSADFTVKDAAGATLGTSSGTTTQAFQKGGLPKLLTIMPNGAYSNPLVSFNYGGAAFTTSAGQCSVGKADSKLGVDYIQFDCGFSC